MTNYERIINLTPDEMAEEIKLIANWNRRQKKKAEKDEYFYINYLKKEVDECKLMYSDYCKNECPLRK